MYLYACILSCFKQDQNLKKLLYIKCGGNMHTHVYTTSVG